MTLSDIAVRRPVFALVVAMVLCIIGLVSFSRLSLRELPNVDPPQVSIGTSYTGASAEVIETRITQIIERQVSAISGIDRLNSSSRDGRSQVNITFTLDRNLEDATNDVRDRVSRVMQQLPDDALAPVVTKADADAMPIMGMNMVSTTMNRLEMTDYINRYLAPRLSTIDGVAQVIVFGGQNYSMRIWIDAEALAARGLTVDDVTNSLTRNNVQLPAGQIESDETDYTINVERTYSTAADFAQLPITTAARAGYVTRLGDVAKIEEGADERRRMFKMNGQDRVGMGITRQSDANDLKISDGVREELDSINRTLPKGTSLQVTFDNSTFTRESIFEVWVTMGVAIALVGVVNFLFLGSWQAALIPTIVAPICIISTFTALAPLGFSINLLTLLALVLAIGLVVDDAIVVTENIQRRIDEGEPPIVAAQRGAKQVFFAVLATTATLISVFTPLMFLPGYTGRLFVELAVAIASAVAFSSLLALTFAPVLCSKLLRPAQHGGPVARAVDRAVTSVRNSYRESLDILVGRKVVAIICIATVVVVGASAAFVYTSLPHEVVPDEDRGRVDIQIQGPEGAGYDYVQRYIRQLEPILQGYVDDGEAVSWQLMAGGGGGFGSNSGGNGNLLLAEHGRERSAQEVAAEINRRTSQITGVRITANVRGAFQRGGGPGGGGGNGVQLIAIGPEYEELAKWTEPLMAAARDNPGFSRINTNYEPVSPRVRVTLNRERAAALGVSSQQVGQALNTMFGPRRVGTYVRRGEEYDILIQTGRENRNTLDDMSSIYVRSSTGGLVPLSNVVNVELRGDLASRNRVDQQRAVSINAQLNPGYTVADAVAFFEAEGAKQPSGPVILWGGAAKDLQDSGNSVMYAFGFALVVVFLVLAAQFESFIHPAIILFTVPLAAAGGLFGLLMFGSSINLYSQVGLIILIGVAAKNGILIVEFANQLRDEGMSVREAVIESAQLRLRPIVMTSIATAVGALPLVLWQGPGSNSRFTIGIVIIMGALFSTLLTLFIVPVMYELLARFTRSPDWTARQIEAFEQQEESAGGLPALKPAHGGAIEAAE
jgi:multidrug efflux pump